MTEPESLRLPVNDGLELRVLRWTPAVVDAERATVPFVLVHGLASNAHLWDGVADSLSARGHVVAAVDQRGHGRSDKPDDGYDFVTVVQDLALVLEGLGGPPPVVAGQSWGGNVVLELAARRPELVRGIACVDGGWIDLTRFPSWEDCERAMAPPRTTGMAATEIGAMLRERHPDWPESGIRGALECFEVRENGTISPWLTFERHLLILRALWEQRVTEIYPNVEVPVLLLPCDDGSTWSESKRKEVALAETYLNRSRTHWFEAEHDVHAQHPTKVADVLTSAIDDGFFV